ncbi:MAG TPA: hypothetical protein VGT81_20755 [Casimicrobiaceae bacterium]|nr:hypothetical protein [Casimicrobiaceae bacterium]
MIEIIIELHLNADRGPPNTKFAKGSDQVEREAAPIAGGSSEYNIKKPA